jgi:hypothetical protein
METGEKKKGKPVELITAHYHRPINNDAPIIRVYSEKKNPGIHFYFYDKIFELMELEIGERYRIWIWEDDSISVARALQKEYGHTVLKTNCKAKARAQFIIRNKSNVRKPKDGYYEYVNEEYNEQLKIETINFKFIGDGII